MIWYYPTDLRWFSLILFSLCFQFGYFPFSSPDAFLLTHLMNSLFLAFHYVCVVTMFLLIVPISSCMLSTFSTRLFSILIRFILMNPNDNSINIWVISSFVSIEPFLCYQGSHFLAFHMSCIFDCMLDILYLKKTAWSKYHLPSKWGMPNSCFSHLNSGSVYLIYIWPRSGLYYSFSLIQFIISFKYFEGRTRTFPSVRPGFWALARFQRDHFVSEPRCQLLEMWRSLSALQSSY